MKHYFLLGAIILAVGSLAGTYTIGRHHGAQAVRADFESRSKSAWFKTLKSMEKISDNLLSAASKMRDAVQASETRETEIIREVRYVNKKNPDFATQRRPTDLERVRFDQFEALREAAEAY